MSAKPSLLRTAIWPLMIAGLLATPGCAVDRPADGTGYSTTAQDASVAAARALVARVLPGHADAFDFERIPDDGGRDVFEIEGRSGRIVLRGDDGVSFAMAFNTYLREIALTNYDWFATGPLEIAGDLPVPTAKIRRTCAAKERFFLNYCTFGYTMPWWNAAQWTRFVDWMAMNGINRPLLQCGAEAVWLEVWKSYGLKEDDIRAYFGGPAHLPWHRMANLDYWGGPLPKSYIDTQRELQKGILAQARGLGMQPVLSGFAGHVPKLITTVRPDAKLLRIPPGWSGMDHQYGTWFVAPTDPLFSEIQKRFLQKQAEMYGTSHRYGMDPFNEMEPPSWDPAFLGNVSKAIYESMAAADPDAVWYQMAWTFYVDKHWTEERLKTMTAAVPKGRMVYLDYVCEETEYYPKCQNFFGAPFIWNYLGNFGGHTHLYGALNKVEPRIEAALKIDNCIGIGSTLEGLDSNPFMYDFVLEQPWLPGAKADPVAWLDAYAVRRAGRKDPAVSAAWKRLYDGVLSKGGSGVWSHGVAYQCKPDYENKVENIGWSNPAIPYKNTDLAKAIDLLFKADPESTRADGYRYDCVNLTRQVLGNYTLDLHKAILADIKAGDLAAFRKHSARFMEVAGDVDALLATRHEFLLGKWIGDARSYGVDAAEKDFYEGNARQIITSWHKPGSVLTEYSNRQWNGLIATYYMPRWAEFFTRVEASMTSRKPFDTKAYTAWRIGFEGSWWKRRGDNFPAVESGDAVATAKKYFDKYREEILATK